MDSHSGTNDFGQIFSSFTPAHPPAVLVVCEHASNTIPGCLHNLGLATDVLESHVAWDPGARGVAEALATRLGAALICSEISRLVYDCNRPPEADSAIPARSEIYDIPGNSGLSPAERAKRADNVYSPFCGAVSDLLDASRRSVQLMVTVHSFTPVYFGAHRAVELGILHGRDDRFATAMMALMDPDPRHDIRLNEPYSAADGVAHSLDLHGASNGLLNVMIEIRNDLIRTEKEQDDMADYLAPWIARTLDHCRNSGAVA